MFSIIINVIVSNVTTNQINNHMARILTGAMAKDYQERQINVSILLFCFILVSVNGVQAKSFLVKEALWSAADVNFLLLYLE